MTASKSPTVQQIIHTHLGTTWKALRQLFGPLTSKPCFTINSAKPCSLQVGAHTARLWSPQTILDEATNTTPQTRYHLGRDCGQHSDNFQTHFKLTATNSQNTPEKTHHVGQSVKIPLDVFNRDESVSFFSMVACFCTCFGGAPACGARSVGKMGTCASGIQRMSMFPQHSVLGFVCSRLLLEKIALTPRL